MDQRLLSAGLAVALAAFSLSALFSRPCFAQKVSAEKTVVVHDESDLRLVTPDVRRIIYSARRPLPIGEAFSGVIAFETRYTSTSSEPRVDAAMIDALAAHSRLQRLSIRRAALIDSTMVPSIAKIKSLEALRVDALSLKLDSVKALSAIPSLLELDVKFTFYTPEHRSLLESIGALGALRRLTLRGGSVSAASLFQLASLKNLDTLELVNTYITGEALEVVGRYIGVKNLIVDGTKLEAPGAFAPMFDHCEVETLSVARCDGLTDEGFIMSLRKCTKLKALSVDGTEFSRPPFTPSGRTGAGNLTISVLTGLERPEIVESLRLVKLGDIRDSSTDTPHPDRFKVLRSLAIVSCGSMTSRWEESVLALKTLEDLEISATAFSREFASGIATLPKLRRLVLTEIDSATVQAVISALAETRTPIQELVLSYRVTNQDRGKEWQRLPELKTLKKLDVSQEVLTTDALLEAILKLPALEEVALFGRYEQFPTEYIQALCEMKTLRVLDLHYMRCSASAVRKILSEHPNVSILWHSWD